MGNAMHAGLYLAKRRKRKKIRQSLAKAEHKGDEMQALTKAK